MRKIKAVLLESIGVFFLRAIVMLLLTAIPNYIYQLSNETKIVSSPLGDYGIVCNAFAMIISVIFTWTFLGGQKIIDLQRVVGGKVFTRTNLIGSITTGVIWGISLTLFVFLGLVSLTYQDLGLNNMLHRAYFLVIVLFTVYSDELFFRGYIITRLNEIKNPLYAIFTSCLINVLFLVAHFVLYDISILSWINSIFIMLICGMLYITYRNVFLTVGCRTVWTFLSAIFLDVEFSSVRRKESLVASMNTDYYSTTLKSFGLTNSIVVTVLLALTFVYVCVRYKRNKVNCE